MDPDHPSSDEGDSASAPLDDALEIALLQRDFITVSRLSFEESVRFHRLEQYVPAVEYSDLALDAWQIHFNTRTSRWTPIVQANELYMLNVSATQHFNRGQFDIATDLIQAARRLSALMPSTSQTASTEWNAALMERWRGDFPTALEHALRAWSVYRANGEPMTIARIRLFIAQLALDCAAVSAARGADQQFTSYLRLAETHLNRARPPADSRYSLAVEGNFRVIYSIYSRLAGKNEDRVGLLESVALLAGRLNDPILEGQAYTTLADELASREGMFEDALTCYRLALDTLLTSHAPAYGVWPLRALKQDWEQNLDVITRA
jgi:tetratricopeptide (TPR) repeat protein